MSEKIGDLYVKIKADVSALVKEVKGLKGELDKDARKISSSFSNVFKKGFDGVNVTVKELKLRLSDLNDKMLKLSAVTGLSVDSLKKVGSGEVKNRFKAIRNEIKATKSEITKLASENSKTANHVLSSGKKMMAMFKRMAIRMGAMFIAFRAIRGAINLTKESKDAARDAKETKTKFEQVFSSIKSKAESTARALAKGFGLANTTARELIGNTGDLLVGFGFAEKKSLALSNKMIKLASDLASFKNISGGTPKVLNLMISAMSGITQASKAVGVVISQRDKDFVKLTKSIQENEGMTFQQARAIAVLNEFFKQSEKAVGDYARTKDNLANVERRLDEQLLQLKITIGNLLNPAFLAFDKILLDILSPSKSLTEQFKTQSDKVKNLEANLLPLSAEYDKLEKKANKNKTEQARLKTIIEQIAENMPSAVTQWDNYGKAIGISTDKIRGNIKTQKILAAYLNKSAIKDEIGNLKDYASLIKETTNKLNTLSITHSVRKAIIGQSGAIALNIELKGENLKYELNKLRAEVKLLNNDFLGSATNLEKLGGTIPTEIMPRIKALRKELEDVVVPPKGKEIATPFKIAAGSVTDLQNKISDLQAQIEGSTEPKVITSLNKKLIEVNKRLNTAQTKLAILRARLTNDFSNLKPKGLELQPLPTPGAPDTMNPVQGIQDQNAALGEQKDIWADIGQAQSTAMGNLAASFASQIQLFKQANSMLEQFLNTLIQVALQQLAITAIGSFADGGSGLLGLIGGLFAHEGGTFYNGQKVASLAGGGSFTVPGGFPNDSYPLLVESGEKVDVTPAGKVGKSDAAMGTIAKSINILNANLLDVMTGSKSDSLNIGIKGELKGQDIYVSGQHAGSVYNRYR